VEECLELLVEAIAASNYTGKVSIALDVAASEFHMEERPGFYNLDSKDKAKDPALHRILSGDQMVEYYLKLVRAYPSKLSLFRSFNLICSRFD
jgi:enolase